MPAFNRVPQGHGGLFAAPSPNANAWLGTDGLYTCLGVYVAYTPAGGALQNFVAHIDCAVVPRQGQAGVGDLAYIGQAARDLMTARLGAYDGARHTNIALYSAGNDLVLTALKAGVALWRGGEAAPAFTHRDGFRVRYDGSGFTATAWNDQGADIDAGLFAMHVPVQPQAPPAQNQQPAAPAQGQQPDAPPAQGQQPDAPPAQGQQPDAPPVVDAPPAEAPPAPGQPADAPPAADAPAAPDAPPAPEGVPT